MKTLARLYNSDYSFDTVDDSVIVTRFSTKFDGPRHVLSCVGTGGTLRTLSLRRWFILDTPKFDPVRGLTRMYII